MLVLNNMWFLEPHSTLYQKKKKEKKKLASKLSIYKKRTGSGHQLFCNPNEFAKDSLTRAHMNDKTLLDISYQPTLIYCCFMMSYIAMPLANKNNKTNIYTKIISNPVPNWTH